MAWRDQYRQASFRGVPFFVDSTDSSHGRRQAVHEHAQRDVPYTEDLGRKAREFTVDGYVLGQDYFGPRDAVIEACETAGPGLLVHPYRGELNVVCRGLSVRESSAEGGMARISMTFLEAGEASFPRTSIDSVNAISSAGLSVETAASAGFIRRFVTDGFPGFLRDAAAAHLTSITDYLSSPGFSLSAEIDAASDFYYSVRNLAADAYDLVLEPVKLADRLMGVFRSVRSGYGSNAVEVLAGMYSNFETPYGGLTQTPTRQQQAANYEALNEITRQAALSQGAIAAVQTEYPSIQDARDARNDLTEAIDVEVERTTSDEAYVALGQLQTQVIKGIPQQGATLPQLTQYTPSVTLPGLLVAYQLYGDASRADEIAKRNKPSHPGFLMGGQPLEVLADG